MKAKSLRKVLSLLMTLAMLLGMLSVTAFAEDTAPTNIAVYVYKNSTTYAVHELGTLSAGATALTALNQADSTVDYNDSTGGAWLYTINGRLAGMAAGDYKVQDGDFLAFYKVPDYTQDSLVIPSYFTEWVDENGRIQSYTTSHTLGNDLGMEMSLDFSHPTVKYITASSIYQAKTTSNVTDDGYMFISASASGHNVLTTCYPVIINQSTAWINQVRSQIINLCNICNDISATEIGTVAKNTLDSKVTAVKQNIGQQPAWMMRSALALEDTFASLTYEVDARLDHVAFSGDISVTEPCFPYTTAYTVQSTSVDPTAVPTNFTMTVTPMDSTATVTVTGSDGVTVTGSDNTKTIILPENATSTLTVTVTKDGVTKTYTFSLTTPEPALATASIYAFLPAPGQFTNEYVTQGGWGDAYNADGTLKMNNSTGMSLGFFGGYVVYQFDQDVLNSNSNPYGADFIVYGNAFWGNSEPGCIQVSQDGSTWYDIAGSRYYNSDTVKDFSLTYQNPNVSEDAGITAAGSNLGKLAAVAYSGSASGAIATNTYHNHSWFPLNANYFSGRYGNAALDKVSALPFASRTIDSGVTDTLTLSGVKLSNVSTSDTAGYGFGYCDVHPNNELGGTVAYNPYQTFSSSSDYSAKTAGTSGGDPIDISWAVDGDGNPVNLSYIRYVRIYTGAAQMNGIFGEISTESLGVAACTGAGTGLRTAAPTVTVDGITVIPGTTSASIPTITYEPDASITIEASASENHIYVNDVSGVGNATKTIALGEEELIVRVIAQDTTTGNPYIGYIRLVGEY